jgi:hypothetical protein
MYNHTNRAVRELNVAVSDGAIAPLAWVWQIATATSSYVDKIYDEFNTEADPFFNERIGCERGALLGRLTALPEALIASAATILCAAELALRAWGNVAGNVLFCDSGKRQISALRVAIFRTTSLPFMGSPLRRCRPPCTPFASS